MGIDRRKFITTGAAALLALGGGVAQAAEYVVLGSRVVNLGSDHDRIYVGLLRGIFSRIRLEVTGNSILMQDLKVTFVNGETADLPVRLFIEKGGHTRDILLPGLLRAIRFIDMRYVRVPLGGRATVTVVGKRL